MASRTWVLVVDILIDICVVVTVPLYVLFLTHLVRTKKKSDNIWSNGFALIMFANGFCDILMTLTSLFFVELPRYGVWSAFYLSPDPWKARICKSVIMGSQIFQMVSASAVAVNRWYAINRPTSYDKRFSPRIMRILYCGLYLVIFVYIAPVFFTKALGAYDVKNGIYLALDEPLTIFIYGISYFVVSVIGFVIWAVVYSQIVLFFAKNEALHKNSVKKTVIKMTAASFLFTLGSMLFFVISVTQYVTYKFFAIVSFFDYDIYFCLTRLGQELTNLSTPWVMLAIFPDMRNGMLEQLGIAVNKNEVTKLKQSTGRMPSSMAPVSKM